MTTLRLELAPATITADTESRRVSGLLVPYGVPGRTSAGEVSIRAGAITLPDTVNRVRLLYGHNRENPIGVALELTDTDTGLSGAFTVARTPAGDTYLAELDPETPIRDGLSVELDRVELDGTEVISAELVAVAAVPLPAYTSARAALAAESTEGEPPMTATLEAAPAPDPATLEAAAEPARPMPLIGTPTTAPARTAPVSALAALTERITAARMEGNSSLAAALTDITPTGNGTNHGDAGLVRQALGELWSGVERPAQYRPLIMGGALTGTKASGFRWGAPPTVADYTGNKAAVPSNAAKLEFVEVPATRIAGAHDIDRIYRDLGDPDVLASYWRQMAYSLSVQLDAKALALIVAAAGTALTTANTAMSALVKGTLAVSNVGAPTFALVSSDLIEAMSVTKAVDALVGPPMDLPPIQAAPALPAKTVIVGCKPAARLLTFEPPIRVEAVNIPNGGIDAGLFSYSAGLVELGAGIKMYTVTAAVADPEEAPATRASK